MKNLILSSFKFGKTKGLLLEGIEESSFLRGLLGEVSCIEPICLFSCICCIHSISQESGERAAIDLQKQYLTLSFCIDSR